MATKTIYMIFYLLHKCVSKLCSYIGSFYAQMVTLGYCYSRQVNFDPKTTNFIGRPTLNISKNSDVTIGQGFICRSGKDSASIDNHTYSRIVVADGARLTIGEKTGISNTCIHCHKEITIGHHVNIGAGCMIFDTDFHSLEWKDRRDGTDIERRKMKPIVIGDYVFIGAGSIILKGVNIGEKSIIGAGSVVSKDIPEGEIWAGNPARFIRKV